MRAREREREKVSGESREKRSFPFGGVGGEGGRNSAGKESTEPFNFFLSNSTSGLSSLALSRTGGKLSLIRN